MRWFGEHCRGHLRYTGDPCWKHDLLSWGNSTELALLKLQLRQAAEVCCALLSTPELAWYPQGWDEAAAGCVDIQTLALPLQVPGQVL